MTLMKQNRSKIEAIRSYECYGSNRSISFGNFDAEFPRNSALGPNSPLRLDITDVFGMAHLVLWWDTYHFFLASKDSGCEKRQPVRANAVTWLFMGIHFHRLERINSEKVCKRLITYYIVSGIFSISILYFQFVDQTTLQVRKTKNHRFVAISTRLLDLQRASAALALWFLECVAVSVWWRAGHRRWRLSFTEFDGLAPWLFGDGCAWLFGGPCTIHT